MAKEKEVKEDLNYAGFWIRVFASVLDFMVILPVIVYLITGDSVYYSEGSTVGLSYMDGNLLISVLYVIGFWIWLGATPGKLILKLKIVNIDGTAVTWKTSLLRYVAYIASALPLFFGFFSVGMDSKKQGWHDKISKTYVIKNS